MSFTPHDLAELAAAAVRKILCLIIHDGRQLITYSMTTYNLPYQYIIATNITTYTVAKPP